jgi:capsular polysaccharide biosynthesis protein
LRELRQYDEAESLLAAAIDRFPQNAWPAVEHALLANVRWQWEEALRRWARVRERFPNEPQAFAGASWALREQGRLAEAEQLLAPGIARFPQHPNVAIEYATTAHQRQDWAAAAARWEHVRQLVPGELRAYLLAAEALNHLERNSEAQAILQRATEQFPNNAKVFIAFAETADRNNRAGKLERWAEAGRRFPADPEIGRRVAAIRTSPCPLEQISELVAQLLPPTTINVSSCLVHTNIPEFDWADGQHLLQNVYVPKTCRLAAVELRCFPSSVWLASATGEDLLPVVEDNVVAEQINPGWDQAKLHAAIAACAPEPVFVDRDVVVIGRFGLRTWGHWLAELLPKVACVEAASPGPYSYAVPADLVRDRHLSTALESLHFHGIGQDRLVLLDVGRRYRFRTLLAVSSVWSDRMIHPGAVAALRRAIPVTPASDRVALMRRESSTRRVANLQELEPVLAASGFRIVNIGQLSFRGQVAVFQRASAVISVLGSGLTGLIYAPPGVRVATLAPIGWTDDFFFAIMQNRSARMAELRGPSLNDDPRGVGVSSFTIAPGALEAGLRALGLMR